MKKGSTLFLKLVILLMGLAALAICIFALPSLLHGAQVEYPGVNSLLYIFIAGLYVSAILFFMCLYQAFKLLNYIDKNQAFSSTSIAALTIITYSSIGISVCYAIGIPFLFHIAQIDDAPGLGAIALAFTATPLVIATFAAVLKKLLQNAIDIQSENDLTV